MLECISISNYNYTNNDNMKNILIFIEDTFEKIINELINNTSLKKLKNIQLSYIIINNILIMTFNIKNNKDFDILFNYVYTK